MHEGACCCGLQARADIQIKASNYIGLRDVQQLVLWVMGEGSAPKWAMIQVCALQPGSGVQHYLALLQANPVTAARVLLSRETCTAVTAEWFMRLHVTPPSIVNSRQVPRLQAAVAVLCPC